MNWLEVLMHKEATRRRFSPQEKIRYFTQSRKGKGRGIVLAPDYARGTVQDYNPDTRRYLVQDESGEVNEVHPRNIVHEKLPAAPVSIPSESITPPALTMV